MREIQLSLDERVQRLREIFRPFRGISERHEVLEGIARAGQYLETLGLLNLDHRLYSAGDPDQAMDVLMEMGIVNQILEIHPGISIEYEPPEIRPSPPDFRLTLSGRCHVVEVKRIRQLITEAIREKLQRDCRERLSGKPPLILNLSWIAEEIENADARAFIEWLGDNYEGHEDSRERHWPDTENPLIRYSLSPRPNATGGIVPGVITFGSTLSGLMAPVDEDRIKRKFGKYLRDAERKFRSLEEPVSPILMVHPGGADIIPVDLTANALFGTDYGVQHRTPDGTEHTGWSRRSNGLFREESALRTVGVVLLSERYFPFQTDLEGILFPKPGSEEEARRFLEVLPKLVVMGPRDIV